MSLLFVGGGLLSVSPPFRAPPCFSTLPSKTLVLLLCSDVDGGKTLEGGAEEDASTDFSDWGFDGPDDSSQRGEQLLGGFVLSQVVQYLCV